MLENLILLGVTKLVLLFFGFIVFITTIKDWARVRKAGGRAKEDDLRSKYAEEVFLNL